MLIRFLAFMLGLALLACASAPIQMTKEAEHVGIGRSDPADNYQLIGPITASDGNGCGLFGRRGTYDHAVVALRVKAASMGADYVAITMITVPHLANPNCFANSYVISGMAYHRTSRSPSPVPIRNVAPVPGQHDIVKQLMELNRLHKTGALSDKEYERAKSELLK